MDEALQAMVVVLVPALGVLLTALLACATAWLRAKTRSLEAKAAVDLAAQVVADVQVSVQHRTVDRLKASGEWNEAAAEQVKTGAVRAALRNLGPENVARLDAALSGAAEQWISTRLEATVARSKRPDVLP
jgi:hypothetical protein